MSKKNNSVKNGQVFTPSNIVKIILDYCDYNSIDIVRKHIIDNSCGKGAFLVEIVERYCKYFFENDNDTNRLKTELETYIHGIEIDKNCYIECINNLDKIVKKYNISNTKWDIYNEDTLYFDKFNGKMDYVVGNPPYIRVHHLENSKEIKEFYFLEKGMIDLYIVFFEISFKMLSKKGKLGLITPSSWFTSKAGNILRDYVFSTKKLKSIIDLGHYQPFKATTYTAISIFDNSLINETVSLFNYLGKNVEFIEQLPFEVIKIEDKFYFSPQKDLTNLKKILNYTNNDLVAVKNGFATLADKIFIGNFKFKSNCIDIIKASTGKWTKCIYPYDKKGAPLCELDSEVLEYLKTYRQKLEDRSIENKNDWFLFGRSQAVKDVQKRKISINSLVKTIDDIKLNLADEGKGVYSGLYILTEIDFNTIRKILLTNDFLSYVKSLKKYKSGGYYTFSSSDLEKYINYKVKDVKNE